jgi:membrane associated rhomboid family serine protease
VFATRTVWRGIETTADEPQLIPIRDDNPTFRRPIVTLILIAANAVMWLAVQGLGETGALLRSICDLGLVPGELLGAAAPGTAFAMNENAACVVDPDPAPLSILTHMFLHGGWLHLLGNLWFLWIFGNNVEDAMGHVRFLIFYLLCGLSAAGLQILSAPDSAVPMVGASGAIGGVMGAYVLLYPRVWVHLLFWLGFFVTRIAVPAWFMLGYWLLIQLLGGAASFGRESGGTAFWAHIGGFVAGGLLALVFRDRALLDRHPYHGWRQKPAHKGYLERLPNPSRRSRTRRT